MKNYSIFLSLFLFAISARADEGRYESGYLKFKVAHCILENPELGGHSSLYMVALVDKNTKKVVALDAPALEFAPQVVARFVSASQLREQVGVIVGSSFIEIPEGRRSLEGIYLYPESRSVDILYYAPGSDDVHVGSMHFENCEIQNTRLLLRGQL